MRGVPYLNKCSGGTGLVLFFHLLYFKSSFFCLKLKILIPGKPIWFYILGKLHIDHVMVLGHFFFRFKFCDGFKLFFNTEPLEGA